MQESHINRMIDDWVTRQPDEPDVVTKCDKCQCDLYEGEDGYKIDHILYCEDCAEEWLDNHKIIIEKDN